MVFVGSNYHSFNQVFLKFRQSQKFWDSRIDDNINVEYFIEGAFDVDGHRVDIVFQQLWNIIDVNPIGSLIGRNEDIESVELVIGGVADSLLHLFGSIFNSIGMVHRPVASKIFPIDRKFEHSWIEFFDSIVNIGQLIVELNN